MSNNNGKNNVSCSEENIEANKIGPFKSFYKDGLQPSQECLDFQKEADIVMNAIYKKYMELGYSPREITAILHSVVGSFGATKTVQLTMKQRNKGKSK